MNPPAKSSKELPANWEEDPVWKLLDQASPRPAMSPALTQQITATARLTPQSQPISRWPFLSRPAILAAAAALILCTIPAVMLFQSDSNSFAENSTETVESDSIDIQEIADTEALIAAVDHLDNFSDSEIVELLGF